jgi:predicted RNase H-like HicB family nuclease
MADNSSYVNLHFSAFEEDGQWVGRCEELGVSTCADTRAAAEAGIVEATTLYLETLQDEGELGRVLAEHGLQVITGGQPRLRAEWEEPIPVLTGIG